MHFIFSKNNLILWVFRGERSEPETKGRIDELDSKLGRSYESNLDSQHVPRHESRDVLSSEQFKGLE